MINNLSMFKEIITPEKCFEMCKTYTYDLNFEFMWLIIIAYFSFIVYSFVKNKNYEIIILDKKINLKETLLTWTKIIFTLGMLYFLYLIKTGGLI